MFGNHGRKEQGYEGNIRTRGGLMYYQTDALGNVMDVTDHIGDTVMKYRYDAFGNLFTQMAAPYNTTGYTGKTYDAKASLMDYSARWYSPSTGRFTTEDTLIGELDLIQSLNRYSYAGNNPVNYLDSTGHYWWCYAVINGKTYSHAPPCDDNNNLVWVEAPSDDDDCCGSGGDDGSCGGSGGSSGGSSGPSLQDRIYTADEIFSGRAGAIPLPDGNYVFPTNISDIQNQSYYVKVENKGNYNNQLNLVIEIITIDIDPYKTFSGLHYSRNKFNIILPTSPELAENAHWENLDDNKSYFHQLGEGNINNQKWISPDGHKEVVFDSKGNIVTDPLNQGSLNIIGPGNLIEDAGHFAVDVVPYIIYGNSANDPSTMIDRIMWSVDGFINADVPKEDSKRDKTAEEVINKKIRNLIE